eukprot:1159047-Prymnesium_polylepis.1
MDIFYSDWWVTLLCEVDMVTHNGHKMPFCLILSGKALKDGTNVVGDLKQTKYAHHNAQKACSTQIGG